MFKNIIIVSIRNILRHKVYSFINIIGLAIGIACCFLILLWVGNEMSFDRFHENADNIYRLCTDLTVGGGERKSPMTSPPMAPAIVTEFPEVISAVRISPDSRRLVQYKDRRKYEDLVRYADSSFFQVFSFRTIRGNPANALSAPYTAVLTEEVASEYFGENDPLGKTIRLDGNSDYTVTAVVENVPENSHFNFNILCSLQTLYAQNIPGLDRWGFLGYYTYILLDSRADYLNLQSKFPELVERNFGERLKSVGASMSLFLQPLASIHLHSNLLGEIAPPGNITNVYLFSGVAFFILIIACFNFINLSTARSTQRSKEVGIRKTLGATRSRVIFQFLAETMIYCLIALLFMLIILELAIPWFNDITGRHLDLSDPKLLWLVMGFLGTLITVGLLAGIYPAIFLSSFKPVSILKDGNHVVFSKSRLRNLLVVVQFAVTVALTAGTIAIYKQIDYMEHKKLGFNKDSVMVLQNLQDSPDMPLTSVKEQFLNVSGVKNVSLSSGVPGIGGLIRNFWPEGRNENETENMRVFDIDDNYISTYGLELAAGRNFSRKFPADENESAIINETAARLFGWENPVGKIIKRRIPGPEGPQWKSNTVIGVLKDFHLNSLHTVIEPLFIGNTTANLNTLSIKISPDNIPHTISLLEQKWNAMVADKPFDYVFVDESFNSMYRGDERTAELILSFSFLAIFIACMGLFGMSSYAAERRTKEIGIRKVLGATIPDILRLLSKEILILIAVSFVIAWPVAFYWLNRWLQNFAYRINLGISIFIFAGLIALTIAILTISFHSVKAALANPVKSLKYE